MHHGGAGTTTAAALAAVPQVVVPHRYDQYYFADRVDALGIGATGDGALERALEAAAVPFEVRTDGTRIAARYVVG